MTAAKQIRQGRIGLIGFGAIGRSVARLLGDHGDLRLGVVTRLAPPAAALPAGSDHLCDLDALLQWQPDIVIEAASAAAFVEFAPACLAAGIDVVAASVGALQDPELLSRITAICEDNDSRLIVPSGAVGGLDHIAAAAQHPDTEVVYISRKPPAAWTAELLELGLADAVKTGEVTIYDGNPREAAARHPKNLNAGLTIALAAGMDRTRVKVIADPGVTENTHEILVTGPLGKSHLRFCNTPDPANPKTSAITAYSLTSATVRRFAVLQ